MVDTVGAHCMCPVFKETTYNSKKAPFGRLYYSLNEKKNKENFIRRLIKLKLRIIYIITIKLKYNIT